MSNLSADHLWLGRSERLAAVSFKSRRHESGIVQRPRRDTIELPQAAPCSCRRVQVARFAGWGTHDRTPQVHSGDATASLQPCSMWSRALAGALDLFVRQKTNEHLHVAPAPGTSSPVAATERAATQPGGPPQDTGLRGPRKTAGERSSFASQQISESNPLGRSVSMKRALRHNGISVLIRASLGPLVPCRTGQRPPKKYPAAPPSAGRIADQERSHV